MTTKDRSRPASLVQSLLNGISAAAASAAAAHDSHSVRKP